MPSCLSPYRCRCRAHFAQRTDRDQLVMSPLSRLFRRSSFELVASIFRKRPCSQYDDATPLSRPFDDVILSPLIDAPK